MGIGERIRTLREKKGLSQTELARLIGVRPQSVQQWEAGKTEPRSGRLEALAEALDTYLAYLRFGDQGATHAELTLFAGGGNQVISEGEIAFETGVLASHIDALSNEAKAALEPLIGELLKQYPSNESVLGALEKMDPPRYRRKLREIASSEQFKRWKAYIAKVERRLADRK